MSIKKKAGLLFLGRTIYSLSQWLVVVLLAKRSNVQDLDAYMLSISITGPFIMFSQMNMRAYLVTDYSKEFKYSEYINARFFLSSSAFLIILVVANYFNKSLYFFQVLFFVALYKTIESQIDIYCGIFQRDFSLRLVAYSNIARGLSSLLAMLLILNYIDDLVVALVVICGAWFGILVIHKYYLYVHGKTDLISGNRFNRIVILVRKCVPLGVVMLLVALNFNAPIYFIEILNNNEGVGVYSSIAYLLLIGKVVSESFVQASAAKVSEYIFKKEIKQLEKLALKLVSLGFCLGIAGLLFSVYFGELFLTLIYGVKFKIYSEVFILIMLAAFFSYISQSYGMILTAFRSIKFLFWIHLIQIIVVVIVCYITIPVIGLNGAALSLVSGYFVVMSLNYALYKININRLKKCF